MGRRPPTSSGLRSSAHRWHGLGMAWLDSKALSVALPVLLVSFLFFKTPRGQRLFFLFGVGFVLCGFWAITTGKLKQQHDIAPPLEGSAAIIGGVCMTVGGICVTAFALIHKPDTARIDISSLTNRKPLVETSPERLTPMRYRAKLAAYIALVICGLPLAIHGFSEWKSAGFPIQSRSSDPLVALLIGIGSIGFGIFAIGYLSPPGDSKPD